MLQKKCTSKVEQLETQMTIVSRLYVALWEKEMQKQSLKLIATAPENRPGPKKDMHVPTNDFQGQTFSFEGG